MSIWLLTLASAGILALVTWQRNKLRSQVELLSRQQHHLETTLLQFMEECEKTFLELTRPNAEADCEVSEPNSAADPVSASLCTRDSGDEITSALRFQDEPWMPTKRNGIEKKHQVLRLAGQGISILDIASRLMIPQGEVELILSLSKGAAGWQRN